MAILNLPAHERFATENIFLPLCVRSSVYAKYGMARIRNGVDQDGVKHPDEPCFADDVNRLGDVGRWVEIPDDRGGGGTEWVRLKLYLLFGAMDHLGAQSCTVHVQCPNAHFFCRACDYDTRSPSAGKPFSFMRQGCAHKDKAARPAFTRRDWPTLKSVLQRLRQGVSATEDKRLRHDYGINKLHAAIDPDHLHHVDPTTYLPQDLLHVFPDGLLRSEGAWLFYILINQFKLSIDKVNARIRTYPHWPADVRIPDLNSGKLKKGAKGGKPKSSTTLKMTGSEAMWFSLHSVEVLEPLLTDAMRQHPAWASWVKLCELFAVCVQHEFHVDDIERIDDLQVEYIALFNAVPEYAGLYRPKHHFLSHLPHDLWLYGPFRGFWTFGFESFNKVIKKGASQSNWQREQLAVMQYWSMWSARQIVRKQRSTYLVQSV